MSETTSRITNAATCKCPRCGKSDIFNKSALNLTKFLSMNPKCEQCGLNFFPEPGFYLGSLYISYFLSSILFLSMALIMILATNLSLTQIFLIMTIVAIVIIPITIRVSRSIWLSINYKNIN